MFTRVLFLLIGLLLLAVSAFSTYGYCVLVNKGVKAEAKVVDQIKIQVKRGYVYDIVLGWKLRNGKYVKHRLGWASSFGPYKGETVQISYDPVHPTELLLVNHLRSTFPLFASAFIGVVFSLVGFCGLRSYLRQSDDPEKKRLYSKTEFELNSNIFSNAGT